MSLPRMRPEMITLLLMTKYRYVESVLGMPKVDIQLSCSTLSLIIQIIHNEPFFLPALHRVVSTVAVTEKERD